MRSKTGPKCDSLAAVGHAPQLPRRAILGGIVATAVTLAGCSKSSNDPQSTQPSGPTTASPPPPTSSAASASGDGTAAASSSTAGKASALPSYVPFTGGHPDLPGTADGVLPGYYHYPANPPTYVTGPVGSGNPLTAMLSGVPIGTPKGKNQWWQLLDKKLGVDLNLEQYASADYYNKFVVLSASGDFPDMAQVSGIPGLPGLLDKYFVDLTDYLGGDNVKKYPGLAALPSTAWTNATLNGKLYGVCQPRSLAGNVLNTRQDKLDSLGIKAPELTNGDDYLALCKELTDAKSNRFAFAQQPVSYMMPGILEMMGCPNVWDVKDGKFTSWYTSEAYPEALEVLRKMWSDKLIHPDSFANPGAAISWWMGDTAVLYYQQFDWWLGYARQYPDKKFGGVIQPKWEGGGAAVKNLNVGAYPTYVGIKKAPKARVEEILRVWDYLAAPFGSQEYLDVNFGVPGHDYTLKGSDPVQNSTGVAEFMQGLIYVGSTQFASLYAPGEDDLVKSAHDFLTTTVPTGRPVPTVGLYSVTDKTKGTPEVIKLNNLQGDIIQGRKPVSAFADAVKTWKSTVGDKIAGEYADAYAAVH